MMNQLENLLGGGQQRQQFQDFSNRYLQGSPHESYSAQEAQQYYQQLAPQLPPQQYQMAAQQTFWDCYFEVALPHSR